MIHARTDYNRFQDPEGKIGEDEPVILFRAQDKHFIGILRDYLRRLNDDPDVEYHMKLAISEHLVRAQNWQRGHRIKTPDMPEDCLLEVKF
jgi:hypothetical protein